MGPDGKADCAGEASSNLTDRPTEARGLQA
jgi:hypothetical protein